MSAIVTVVVALPDFYRATISKRISWTQLSKNLAVNTVSAGRGLLGGYSGAIAEAKIGALVGSIVPGVGNAIGGTVGAVAGAIGGGAAVGALGAQGSKTLLNKIVDDDAKKMLTLVQDTLSVLATDYLCTEEELAIRLAVECVASFGYNHKSLTASYVIIPVAYYFYKIESPRSYVKSVHTREDRRNIQKFVTIALLKRIFGGQPDNVLRPIRDIIRNHHVGFPFDQIKNGLKVTNKTMKMDADEINELLYTSYGNNYAFSVLSLLYPMLDYSNHFHQDHIYPKSLLSSRFKLKKRGMDDSIIDYCEENYNYLENLQ